MGNTKKSFKGTPTVNLVPTPDTMAGFSNYWYGPAVAKYFPDLGCSGFTLVNAGSWNGVWKDITLPSTGTYTFSMWTRYHGGSVNNNGGVVYVSGWGGGDSANGINKALVGIWQRVSITLACTTTTPRMYLISYGGTDGIDYSSWDIAMPQVEAGSVATPFVVGTRSTANNLIDLTGNNTITANSLAYNSDGTFTFAGGVNYLSVASALSAAVNEVTLIAVVNLLTAAGPHQTAICTDLNYQRGIKLMAAYHAQGPAVWVGNSDGTGGCYWFLCAVCRGSGCGSRTA